MLPLHTNSLHMNNLYVSVEAQEYLKNIKLPDGQLVSSTPRKTTILGFTIATSSLVGLFDTYVKQKALLKYVLGYKFSQVIE